MKRALLVSFFVMVVPACSDAPDRSAVGAMLELTILSEFRNRVNIGAKGGSSALTAEETARFKSLIKKFKSTTLDCLYGKTNVDSVDWPAVNKTMEMARTMFEENKDDVLAGELDHQNFYILLMNAIAGEGGDDIFFDKDVLKAGMEGYKKWQSANQDCIDNKTWKYQKKIRELESS